jgi:hypothetical protein
MRLKIFGLGLFILLAVSIAYAQDEEWTTSDDGFEYNCALLTELITAVDDEDSDALSDLQNDAFARNEDGDEISLATYTGSTTLALLGAGVEVTSITLFASASSACGTSETSSSSTEDGEGFNVVVNGNVNVRSCAGTDCEVVGQAADGSVLAVVAIEEDWYEVEFEDGTAFIASWLVTRGPDLVIDVDERYENEAMGCLVVFDIQRGDTVVSIIMAGDRRNDIFVDLYRPNESDPLDVESTYDKTFIDTGDPYVQQYYHWGLYWPAGVYQLEVTIDDETVLLAWELEDQGEYTIFVVCD